MSYVIIAKEDEKSYKIKELLKEKIKDIYDEKTPTKIITVGGDGTFLKSIHKYDYMLDEAVFFILNTGHLGYFSNFDESTLDELVFQVNQDEYRVSDFSLLKYKINTSKEVIEGFALNEVTIINPTRTLMLDVFLDNVLLEHFRGTGVCISTPAGSTAYNKSLGGAVLDSSLEAYQVTEIASINSKIYHTLSSPLILSKNHEVEFKTEGSSTIWITVDSKSINIEDFISIDLTLSDKKIKYARNGKTFIKRLVENFI